MKACRTSQIFAIFVISCTLLSAIEIPDEIAERLRQVRTRQDMEASFTLNHGGEQLQEIVPLASRTHSGHVDTAIRQSTGHQAAASTLNLSFTPIQARMNSRRMRPSLRSSAAVEPVAVKIQTFKQNSEMPMPTIASGMDLITDPVQSEDTCLKLNVCVPVPIEREPQVYFFPQCIELPQCLGKCCDGKQQCHAQEVEQVQVMVEKWEYEGIDPDTHRPKFSSKEKKVVIMDKHMACGCKTCSSRVKRSCNVKQEFKDCKCQCANQTNALSCTGNWKWDKDECSCRCGLSSCPANRLLNRFLCRCVENPNDITPVPNGARSNHGGFAVPIPRQSIRDLPKFPRLRATRRHRRIMRPSAFL